MDSRLTLGLELPPLHAAPPAGGGERLIDVLGAARAAEQAGIGTLWLPGARSGGVDAGVMAGGVAAVTDAIGVGVVDRPVAGRHPSVLAREVVALDRLSGGRAVVSVLDDGDSTDDVVRLVESAWLLRRLLTEHGVTMAGRYYEVAELTIRPRPLEAQGPPVLAGLAGAPAPEGANAAAVADAGVAGLVTGGGPVAVASWRRRLTESGAGCGLIWRGAVPADPAAADELVAAVLDHGADGVVAVVPGQAASGGLLERSALDAALAALARAARRLSH